MVDYPADEGGFLTHATVIIVYETRDDVVAGIYVTSQDGRRNDETDVAPQDWAGAGLSSGSVIRCGRVKPLSTERMSRDGSWRMGELSVRDRARVSAALRLARR